jgi:hypothetical protein
MMSTIWTFDSEYVPNKVPARTSRVFWSTQQELLLLLLSACSAWSWVQSVSRSVLPSAHLFMCSDKLPYYPQKLSQVHQTGSKLFLALTPPNLARYKILSLLSMTAARTDLLRPQGKASNPQSYVRQNACVINAHPRKEYYKESFK